MSPRPPQPEPPADDEHDAGVGAALSGLPVPDHGPTFWADLSTRLEGETPVSKQTGSVTEAGPDTPTAAETTPVGLDDRRARRAARRGRTTHSLGAAAAVVALVVAAAGAVSVIRDNNGDSQVRTAGPRPTDTTQPANPTATAPAEFTADYEGIDSTPDQECPDDGCRPWQLTLARDGSFRWTRSGGSVDMAYDASTGTGRQVESVARGAGASPEEPNVFETTGVPAGGPDMRIAKPDPLGPMADVVVALARAGDPRITTATSRATGRPVWRFDGPTVQDRLGGDAAPNHAVAEVDQASGVLLELTRSVNGKIISRFGATGATTADQVDRSKYRLDPPPGAKPRSFSIGFVPRTLDEAPADLPYPLLVPAQAQVPPGFTLVSVAVNRDVSSPTGPEGMNPPATHVVAMTWRNGAHEFTVTLRPSGGEQWDDPFGAEGMVADSQPVRLELDGRPPLEGSVTVDAPLRPHLWGITGDIVVTVSGDLPRAEFERVAGSLRPHRAG